MIARGVIRYRGLPTIPRNLLLAGLVLAVAACAAAPPKPEPILIPVPVPVVAPPTIEAPAPVKARESDACRESRTAILAAMAASREQRACAVHTDCAVVMGPGNPWPDYKQVVHGADAAPLDARVKEHFRTCGVFQRHDASDTFTTVEARCLDARCAASETTFHIQDDP